MLIICKFTITPNSRREGLTSKSLFQQVFFTTFDAIGKCNCILKLYKWSCMSNSNAAEETEVSANVKILKDRYIELSLTFLMLSKHATYWSSSWILLNTNFLNIFHIYSVKVCTYASSLIGFHHISVHRQSWDL